MCASVVAVINEGGATVAKELIFVSPSREEPVCLISWMNLRTATHGPRPHEKKNDKKKKKVFKKFFLNKKKNVYRLSFLPPVSLYALIPYRTVDRLNYFLSLLSHRQRNITIFITNVLL